MKLTGKCKINFEKWYLVNECDFDRPSDEVSKSALDFFYQLDSNMKYGVYVDFFDSVGISVDAYSLGNYEIEYQADVQFSDEWYPLKSYKTRPQARIKAINKANEIYNIN